MNPNHERILLAMAELSKLCPNWRIGQMVCNLTNLVKVPSCQADAAAAIWDIEDEELLASAEEFLANLMRAVDQAEQDLRGAVQRARTSIMG